MLMVRRRVGERIVVGGTIEVHITAATRTSVRLGVSAPRGVLVLRGEVHDAVLAANMAATTFAPEDAPTSDELIQTPPTQENAG